jgi:ABC-2 type transport system permease protein
MTFMPLMQTGENTGTVPVDKIFERDFTGRPSFNRNKDRFFKATDEKYVMGAYIHGSPKPEGRPLPMSDKEPEADASTPAAAALPADAAPATEAPAADSEKPVNEKPPAAAPVAKGDAKAPELRVVLVPDIDCLRARGTSEEEEDIDFQMQNVTFVLNTLDELAGDDRFIPIRKRTTVYKTLAGVSEATEKARKEAETLRVQSAQEFEKEKAKMEAEVQQDFSELKKQKLTPDEQQQFIINLEEAQRRLKTKLEQKQQQLERKLKTIDHNRSLEIRAKQDEYKLWAVILPPIPPLVLAFFVFFNRRAQERVGVSKERLR